jgi:metal-responsive CopG/Arc/MetJ family transcriptional regulator
MTKHLATITILSDDRHNNSSAMQKVMTEESRLIRARLGINLSPMCSVQCPGLITLVVEGTLAEIKTLTAKFNKLKAVKARSLVITK